MPISKDSKNTKPSKRTYRTRSNSMNEERKLKKNADSDSSEEEDLASTHSDSDSDEWEEEDEEGGEEMDMQEYRKFVSKLFPSKFLKEKIKTIDAENKIIKKNKKSSKVQEEEGSDSDDEEEEQSKKMTKSKSTKSKNNKKHKRKSSSKVEVLESDDESESLGEDDTEDECDSDDEEEEEEDIQITRRGKKGFNIVFTIGDPMANEDEDEDSDYDEEEDSVEDEEDDSDSDEEDSNELGKTEEDIAKQQDTINEIRRTFEGILEKDKTNKIALDGLKNIEEKEKKLKKQHERKLKTQKTKNVRKFKNLVNKKNLLNDYAYFKDNLSLEEQKKVLAEVEEINKINIVQKPYRLTLLESDIPVHLKSIALNKISSLRHMDPGNGEYYKIKNWVDTFMQIPFNRYRSLPLSIENGIDECHDYMANSKAILDQAVYGLNDAKLQIMQMVGQWISNPTSIGTAIAIKGPMGTGKTTLVKEGISKILNRDFAFIALGGATDSSFLEGHSYTYEGSTWGKIVDILVKTKSMNPVIYFDELDKISDTAKGEEIAGILTHLTDTAQNSQFHDKYFSEIDFDLSKCLFIFSYNDESRVNPILLDRMYKIQTAGYEKKDKRTISKDYLIPTIIKQVNFKEEDIIIPDETIDYLVENYTEGEKGVRNLKRSLEIIYTKLNLYRLMKPDSTLFEKEMTLKVEFPYTVTTDIVKKLIKKDEQSTSTALYGLYV
jgi:ATP-dependent Lon protease